MAVQTTYSATHAALYPGMFQSGNPYATTSKLNANASALVIPFGTGVVSSGEDGMDFPIPASTALDFVGVAAYELNHTQADGAVAGVPADKTGTVISHGVVAVTVLDTVTKDAQAYLRVGATGAGSFSGIVGTGDTLGVLLTGAKFLTGGVAGDTVLLSLGLGG